MLCTEITEPKTAMLGTFDSQMLGFKLHEKH